MRLALVAIAIGFTISAQAQTEGRVTYNCLIRTTYTNTQGADPVLAKVSQSLKVVVNLAARQCIAPRATECNVGPQEIELKGTKPMLFPADMKGKASRLFPHVDSVVVDRETGEFTYFVAYDDSSGRLTRHVKDGVCSTGR